VGIAPDLIDRVLDMFVQQEQTIARSEGGLGLGLTIVRNLVGLHGGRVRLHSDGVGKGSALTVELPAAPCEAAAQAAKFQPEIALLDLGLPGLDVYDLARAMQQRSNGTAVPRLVALTGYGLDTDRARSPAAGFADHLVKPADLSSLNRVLSGPLQAPAASDPQ